MDRIEAMAIFIAVVEKGSFSAVSKALRMPLATVSRKVADLEAHLGTKLLIRTTRKLALTQAGIAYTAAAKRILEDIAETERHAAGEIHRPSGELILTAPVLLGRLHLLPIVTDFLAAYPAIDVRLILSDRNLHLIDDHIDLALRTGALADSSAIATRLGTLRMVVCASPKLLAAHGTPKTPMDLSALPCVNFDALASTTSWTFPSGASRIDVPVHTRLCVTTAEAAVWAAIQGIGATRLLHYQCAEALGQGSLKLILQDYEPPPLPVHLIHAGRGTLPLKMRAFLDFATPRLKQQLHRISQAGG